MSKRTIFLLTFAAIVILLPEFGFADDKGKDLLDGQLDGDVQTLVKTLFGYPVKIAGVMAGAYGMLQTYFAASPKPLMMWGGVSLLTFFMPKILKALFAI